MKALLKLQKNKTWAIALVVLVGLLFGLLGMYLLHKTNAATASAQAEAESGTPDGAASVAADNAASGGKYVRFAAGGSGQTPSSSKPCGVSSSAQYHHVIWIWEENKDQSDVIGNAPYIDSMQSKCAALTNVRDSATDPSLPSEPSYAASTSGSNCNKGITSPNGGGGSGCITDDNDAHSLSTTSIFQLAKSSGGSWKSYQEDMPSNCATRSSGNYGFKHNPAAMYSQISSDCKNLDIPIPGLDCNDSSCGQPSGALVDDIKNGALPTFAFVTPNLDNDMHDGSVQRGDSWLKTYLPLIMDGPNYKAGDTAIFVMWDEGSGDGGVADIPTLAVAPSIPTGTKVSKATNNIGILRTTQEMLGLTPLLGCAGGTPPGGTGSCVPESSVSVKTDLHL